VTELLGMNAQMVRRYAREGRLPHPTSCPRRGGPSSYRGPVLWTPDDAADCAEPALLLWPEPAGLGLQLGEDEPTVLGLHQIAEADIALGWGPPASVLHAGRPRMEDKPASSAGSIDNLRGEVPFAETQHNGACRGDISHCSISLSNTSGVMTQRLASTSEQTSQRGMVGARTMQPPHGFPAAGCGPSASRCL
jgi:hypothetical protein